MRLELPREFAVEKSTAVVQGLRPKWTHAVARFYIVAPLVAKNVCETVRKMCDVAVMRIMGHGLGEMDAGRMEPTPCEAEGWTFMAAGGWLTC